MSQPGEVAPAGRRPAQPFVTVACKIAIAWFDLRICEEKEIQEMTQTGPRTIKQWFPTGEIIRIRGTAFPRGEPPEGYPEKPRSVLGYALTEGVPRSLWDKWLDQNKKAPYVKSGMIIAFESLDAITGYAKEHQDERSGLEPLGRKGKVLDDARIPKSSVAAVSSIESDSSRMAERSGG